MNRSWVRFPQAAQIRPPGSGWAFLYAVAVLLVAPRVFRAPEAPAAREARRPHFVRRRASKPARALRSLRRPPHQWGWVAVNSPARPCHRPPAPRQVPPAPSTPVVPGVLIGLARRLEARPVPAAAHRHRGRSLRHPRAPQSDPAGTLHTSGAWCARGRRPAREPSAPRALLGASPRGQPRP